MRLILMTSVVMVAFAANSVLNRMALVDGTTGAASFAAVRLLAGAGFLIVLAQLRPRGLPWADKVRLQSAAYLALYVLGFSFAYFSIDAGVGALILFGGVQLTMFAGAVVGREKIPAARWVGATVAFSGLLVLMWPTQDIDVDRQGVVLMIAAAVGWGMYSLLGRRAVDPIGATAVNFAYALPVGILAYLVFGGAISAGGMTLAIISGAVTSGAGYALWYSILPALQASVAAVAQLSVPIIAAAGGLLILGEPVTARFAIATVVVLGGIAISLKK